MYAHCVPSSHENSQIPERYLGVPSCHHTRVGGGVWEGGEAGRQEQLYPTRS